MEVGGGNLPRFALPPPRGDATAHIVHGSERPGLLPLHRIQASGRRLPLPTGETAAPSTAQHMHHMPTAHIYTIQHDALESMASRNFMKGLSERLTQALHAG